MTHLSTESKNRASTTGVLAGQKANFTPSRRLTLNRRKRSDRIHRSRRRPQVSVAYSGGEARDCRGDAFQWTFGGGDCAQSRSKRESDVRLIAAYVVFLLCRGGQDRQRCLCASATRSEIRCGSQVAGRIAKGAPVRLTVKILARPSNSADSRHSTRADGIVNSASHYLGSDNCFGRSLTIVLAGGEESKAAQPP